MFERSRGSWLSLAGMIASFMVVITTILLTYMNRTARYWPLLIVGLVTGCTSAPFYYYFKAKDQTARSSQEAEVQALAAVGQQIGQEKKDTSDGK